MFSPSLKVAFTLIRRPTAISLAFLLLISPLASAADKTEEARHATEATAAKSPDNSTKNELNDVNKITVHPTKPDLRKDVAETQKAQKDLQNDREDNDAQKGEEAAQKENRLVATASQPQAKILINSTIKQPLPKADEVSGGLAYSYTLTVPPGRNALQPNLGLTYNSQAIEGLSLAGAGWSISIPSIERFNKTGSDKLYLEDHFQSSLGGELISLGTSTFGAKVENGDFLKYTFTNNFWICIDKVGTTYKFGASPTARQDNPSDPSKVYRWMLEEVRDTNDNFIRYEYSKDRGQIYPYRIIYTGNGTVDGPFDVLFSTGAASTQEISYQAGFAVVNQYWISGIQVRIQGQLIRQYDLSYSGSAPNKPQTLLASVTENNFGETATPIRRTTSFTYSQNTTERTWQEDSNWQVPQDVNFSQNGTQSGWRITDYNGDGLSDFVQCENCDPWSTNKKQKFYMNTGSGWQENINVQLPADLMSLWLQAHLIDINGDGLTDILVIRRSEFDPSSIDSVFLNNGAGWVLDSSWQVPPNVILPEIKAQTGESAPNRYGWVIADINGDNLPDFVRALYNCCGDPLTKIYLNTGSGWIENTTFQVPTEVVFGSFDTSTVLTGQVLDVNSDGLADIIYEVGSDTRKVYLNSGTNWVLDPAFTFPSILSSGSSFGRSGIVALDVDGDGYPDLVRNAEIQPCCDPPIYYRKTYSNSHRGWLESTVGPVALPNMLFYSNVETETEQRVHPYRFADINGDGLPDVLAAFLSYYLPDYGLFRKIYINNSTRLGLLTSITYPSGGSTSISYKPTTQYRNGNGLLNPSLPYPLYSVAEVTNNDGFGLLSSIQYQYEGGRYSYNGPFDRRFSGFSVVTQTNDLGYVSRVFYHQGDSTNSSTGEHSDHVSKIGKPYRTEVADAVGTLSSKTINRWENYDLGGGRNFVKLTQTIESAFGLNSSHKDKAETYLYDDSIGNLIQMTEWGEVVGNDNGTFSDIGSDKFNTTISYASNPMLNILDLPSQETKVDNGGSKIKDTRYYYDGTSTLGSVSKGNLTKEERWKESSIYVNTQKEYSSYGLPTKETDARGKWTLYNYDPYNLYPASITNARSQTTQYSYDYSCGKAKQVTDPNGFVFQTLYDGLGRVIAEKQPDSANSSMLVLKASYSYTQLGVGTQTIKTEYLDASNTLATYAYTDGFDRIIQKRRQAEALDTYVVTELVYNSVEQLQKETLPYFSTGYALTPSTTDDRLYIKYAYDPTMRVTAVSNNLGDTKTVYNGWKLTVIDANNHSKNLYKDAYGNLIKVEELNAGSVYTTSYSYDGIGKLKSITDASGNIRNFTYDGLGLRRTAEDLHDPADTTFGKWSYTYDNNGNLVSTKNPNGQVVNYTYDELNRIGSEDYTGQAGIEVTYTYDCLGAIGRLCSVKNAAVNETRQYDALGRVIKETKVIGNGSYDTTYSYDRLGNILVLTNPGGSQIKYEYNRAGLIDRISYKEPDWPNFISIVSNLDYNPEGKIGYAEYANGAKTTNTYAVSELYRLKGKVTTLPITGQGTKRIQDLTYTYDPVGNIKQLVDTSETNSKKTINYVYDDLNRLTSAVATNAVNNQNYSEIYAYDAIGNIINKTGQGNYKYTGNAGSNYANPHAVTSVGTTTYSYDNNGNLLRILGGPNYTWDYNNRLIKAVVGVRTITYTYDYSGQRASYSVGGNSVVYPSKYFNVGASATKHIFAGKELIATVKGGGTSVKVYYIHTDHLSGPSVISNQQPALEELTDYYPFGSVRLDEKASTFSEQRKYACSEFDIDTSLDYMNARYYDPAIGKFVSQDAVFLDIGRGLGRYSRQSFELQGDPQELNSYAYARNNPLRYIDPTGLYSLDQFKKDIIKSDRYNPLNFFYGASVSQLSNGIAERNLKEVGLAVVNIGVTSIVIESSALDFGLGLGGAYLWANGITSNFQNLSNLNNLTVRRTASDKLSNLSSRLGISEEEVLTRASQSTMKYVDTREGNAGNINIWIPEPKGSGYIRVTTNPQGTVIISAGQNSRETVQNGISKGNFVPLKKQ